MDINNAQIDNFEKRITINGDEARVIVFNPRDTIFAEKFYDMVGEFKNKLYDMRERAEELDKVKSKDENGMPLNWRERIALQRDFCEHFRQRIDDTFGAGTSQTAFGDTRNIEVFTQFFNGILPHFQKARADKIEQYTTDAGAKRKKRK